MHFSRRRLPIGSCYFEGSYFDCVSRELPELFGLSSNPDPKIDLPLGDLEGRLDKEPAKNVPYGIYGIISGMMYSMIPVMIIMIMIMIS